MVETAMLAAVGGFSYAVASVFRLSGYLAYFMPLPVVLSALRNGAAAGQWTALTTFILLLGKAHLLSIASQHSLLGHRPGHRPR